MRRPPPVAGYCPLYEIQDGQGFCAGHSDDPYYLAGCVAWPTTPNEIVNCPSCTYTFAWTD